jgi:hypothetical protein
MQELMEHGAIIAVPLINADDNDELNYILSYEEEPVRISKSNSGYDDLDGDQWMENLLAEVEKTLRDMEERGVDVYYSTKIYNPGDPVDEP